MNSKIKVGLGSLLAVSFFIVSGISSARAEVTIPQAESRQWRYDSTTRKYYGVAPSGSEGVRTEGDGNVGKSDGNWGSDAGKGSYAGDSITGQMSSGSDSTEGHKGW